MKMKQLITVIRWLLAAGLFYSAYRNLGIAVAVDSEDVTGIAGGYNAIPKLITGIGIVVGAVACLAPELIEWGSMPFRALFNAVFFPGTRETPPPDYNLPRLYREQGRDDEALEGYLKILRHHPQELLAYLEGIQTAFECGNVETARKILRMGLHALPTPEVRDQVQRVFDSCETPLPPLLEEDAVQAEEEAPPPGSER